MGVSSIPMESEERKVITTRSHLMFAVRECCEQMHRGDHPIFGTHLECVSVG